MTRNSESDLFYIHLELFRAFRGLLLPKQITGRELLFGSKVHTNGSSFGCPNLKFHYRVELTFSIYVTNVNKQNIFPDPSGGFHVTSVNRKNHNGGNGGKGGGSTHW